MIRTIDDLGLSSREEDMKGVRRVRRVRNEISRGREKDQRLPATGQL